MLDNNEQSAFCLKEIANSKNRIIAISEQLPKLRANYDKYKSSGLKAENEALNQVARYVYMLLEEFPELLQALNEYGDAELISTTDKLYAVLKKYNYLGVPDYTQLTAALNSFADGLPTEDHNINMKALAHLANRARMGYFPTDLNHVDKIKKAMVFPDECVNVIDPCCGEGIALEAFVSGEQANTYGVELDEVRGEEARNKLDRVALGSFFNSRVSNNAFQCLWLNPPYLSVPGENGNRRLEKSFLIDSIRLLQNDGILIYIIPYHRATYDVCRVLCENFTDLRVHKFEGKEFEHFKQVVFIGRKVKHIEALKQAERLMLYMLKIENIPSISNLPEAVYELPQSDKKVEVFKGAVFNISELEEQLKKSKSTELLFEERALDNRSRQPLLPFNLSQVGLVGASGMMNGLVSCDTPHIIKGRIIKEKKTKVGGMDKYGNTEVREITSNKLIFNVLTESGLKQLG